MVPVVVPLVGQEGAYFATTFTVMLWMVEGFGSPVVDQSSMSTLKREVESEGYPAPPHL